MSRTLYERWVRDHHAGVYRSAFRIVLHAEDALDITQQVFLQALEQPAVFESALEPGKLLRWRAVQTSLRFQRGERHRALREARHAMDHDPHARGHDPAHEPPGLVGEQERRALLQRMLAELPEPQRVCIELHFQEGLTFAQIGSALALSASSVHERVQHALERLRLRLRQAGHAAFVAALEAQLEVPNPVAVPSGLEARLLQLQSGAAATAAEATASSVAGSLPILVLAGIVAAAGMLVFRSPYQKHEIERGTASSRLSPLEPPAESAENSVLELVRIETPPVAALPPGPLDPLIIEDLLVDPDVATPFPEQSATAEEIARIGKGMIRGSLVSLDGTAVSGLRVHAHSLRREDKLARFAAHADSDARGRFELQLPVESEQGETYELYTSGADYLQAMLPRTRVLPSTEHELGETRLTPDSDDAFGEFTLRVRMIDPDAAPLAGHLVHLLRSIRNRTDQSVRTFECSMQTDAAGEVLLSGRRLGPKILRVANHHLGFQSQEREIRVDHISHQQLEWVIPRCLSIRGLLRSVAGEPIASASVNASRMPEAGAADTPDEDFQALVQAGGTFVIAGLDAGAYQLSVQGERWSKLRVDDVEAGTESLEITLKPRELAVDIGQHLAELHGSVVDARDGSPVLLGWSQIDVQRLDPDTAVPFSNEFRLERQYLPPYQTAYFLDPPPPSAEFHETGLDPGVYAIIVRKHGFAPLVEGPFRLEARQILADLRLELQVGRSLCVQVSDPRGKPVVRAAVVMTADSGDLWKRVEEWDREIHAADGQSVAWFSSGWTDQAGRFKDDHLQDHLTARLVVLHPRFEPLISEVFVTGEQPIDLYLRLTKAR